MSRLAGLAIALVAITVILVAGFYSIEAAFAGTATAEDVTNESHFPDNASTGFQAGENFSVNESSVQNYSETVTVYDENDTLQSEGTDYAWNESETNGSVTVLAGGGLINDSNATVSYTYYTHSSQERAAFAFWNSFAKWLPALVIVIAGLFILVLVGALS